MENKDHKSKKDTKTSGSAKEKATFDQNGKGNADKFGAAGEDGLGTAKKDKQK